MSFLFDFITHAVHRCHLILLLSILRVLSIDGFDDLIEVEVTNLTLIEPISLLFDSIVTSILGQMLRELFVHWQSDELVFSQSVIRIDSVLLISCYVTIGAVGVFQWSEIRVFLVDFSASFVFLGCRWLVVDMPVTR